ncbi:MAG: hypothetical protein FJW14_14660 [Acidimicrobiia bacterium]|nr:hypothetical protein [Acidimicrobiia bacterium]
MLPITLLAAAALLVSAPAAFAQDDQAQTQAPAEAAAPPVRYAVPRSQAPQRSPERAPAPARQAEPQRVPIQRAGPVQRVEPMTPPQAQAPVAQAPVAADDQQRRAVPRGSRPREDNPPVGTAVPRAGVVRPPADRGPRVVDRGPRVVTRGYYRTPTVYNNYYYYPRRSYPYGYGAFGLGYFYYDPYRWSPGLSVNLGVGSGYPYYGGYYGGGYYGGGYYGSGGYYPRPGYPVGHLRLRVTPRHAQVFVDGYYAGVVDDYDGIVQALSLEDGPYHIELVAPGYEPLEFDVRIIPGQKITYRGDLIPQRP